jgi:hypothetical protein
MAAHWLTPERRSPRGGADRSAANDKDKEHHVIRVFWTACLLIAVEPLLIGAGVLAKWVIECGGGACVGTVRADSPLGTPRDLLLTAFVAAAPYLLGTAVVAGTWLLTGREARRSVGRPFPAQHPLALPQEVA